MMAEPQLRRTPKQKRAREKYLAILDASIVVLAREGYQGATTSNIAEESGVAVGSLYEYFPNKESIFTAYLDEHIREIIELFRQNLGEEKQGLDQIESLRNWLITIVGITEKNKNTLRTILSEIPGSLGLLSFEGIEDQLMPVARFLTEGMSLDEEELKTKTYVLSNALYGFILRNLFSVNKLDVEKTVDELIKLIVSYGSS